MWTSNLLSKPCLPSKFMKQTTITLLSVVIMTPFVGFAQTANVVDSTAQTALPAQIAKPTPTPATTPNNTQNATENTTQTTVQNTDKTTTQTTAVATTETNSTQTDNTTTADGTPPAPPPPASPHDPNAPTLAELAKPDDSELSKANTELLAKNSELQGRIDELTTQVNVLVNERSGQLFLYGAVSTFVAFVTGLMLAFLISSKRK